MSQGWSKAFQKFTWYNSPNQSSPLNEANLNAINRALDTTDSRVIELDSLKADNSIINNMVQDVTLNQETGILTVTKKDGTTVTYDTALEKIAINFRFDPVNEGLVIDYEDGSQQFISLASLVKEYEFMTTDTIAWLNAGNQISGYLVDGSVTERYIDPEFVTRMTTSVTAAESYAEQSENNAQTSEYNAKMSQSYAIGHTGYREDEDTSNARYYYEEVRKIAEGGLMPTPSAKDKLLISDEDLKWVEIDKSEIGGGGSGMPTPSAADKLLISNSSLEWEEIDKSDISEHYELPIASADTLGGIKIGSGLNISEDGTVSVNPNTVHIQYVTSGTLEANTTTAIHVNFEREYINIPKVLAEFTPLQSNFPTAYAYITSVTNVTNTGCDVNIVRVGSALNLTENRRVAIVIESQDTVGNGGAIADVVINDNERVVGTYFGKKLYEKTIIVDSTQSGYQAIPLNVQSTYGWIERGFIRYDANAYTVSVSPFDDFNYNVPCKVLFAIGDNSRIDYRCSSDYVGCKAEFTVRYTKE